MLTFGISLLALLFNLKAVVGTKTPLIFAIDGNGTRIVNDLADPIFKTEALAFIQTFIFNTYNFSPDSFLKRIGFVTTVMSDDLWNKKKQNILDLKDKIERDQIKVSGTLVKLTKDDEGVFHAFVSVTEQSRLATNSHNLEVSLKLRKTDRSAQNSYGLEVESYEETIVRN